VWISTCARPEGVALTVENSGELVTPELASTLTEPFQRGTERIRRDHAGVGLGLTIVKSITQAPDGTLVLAPRPGGGPRATVQPPAARLALGDPHRPRHRRRLPAAPSRCRPAAPR